MACKLLGPSTGGCWRSRTHCNKSSCFGRIVPRRTVVGSSSHDQPATSQRSMDTLDLLLGSTDPSPGLTHNFSPEHISGLCRCLQPFPFVPRTNTQTCSQRTISMRLLQLLLLTSSIANPRHKQNKAPKRRAARMRQLADSKQMPAQGRLQKGCRCISNP